MHQIIGDLLIKIQSVLCHYSLDSVRKIYRYTDRCQKHQDKHHSQALFMR